MNTINLEVEVEGPALDTSGPWPVDLMQAARGVFAEAFPDHRFGELVVSVDETTIASG